MTVQINPEVVRAMKECFDKALLDADTYQERASVMVSSMPKESRKQLHLLDLPENWR